MPDIIKVAVVGCGARGRLYARLMAQRPDNEFRIVAAADPVADRRRQVAAHHDGRTYPDAAAFFADPTPCDLIIVATQDSQHFDHCRAALQLGAHVLLEKPIAPRLDQVEALERLANERGLRVVVCHVLRYSPLYRRVRELLDADAIGRIISIDAHEGVEPYHHAHSFVRGHWGVVEKSAPMILAKSCHDMDLLAWFAGAPATAVRSVGSCSHFTAEAAPAGAPDRCHQGCPVADSCFYNANRYLGDKKGWLAMVHPSGKIPDVDDPATRAWLEASPWGRCVYRCDNTTVDHQAVIINFANHVTATFTLTAFDCGRHLEIHGTTGRLRAGDTVKRLSGHDIVVESHSDVIVRETLATDGDGYDGHLGGDAAMVATLYSQFTGTSDPATALAASVESHRIAFAAETDRQNPA